MKSTNLCPTKNPKPIDPARAVYDRPVVYGPRLTVSTLSPSPAEAGEGNASPLNVMIAPLL
jgi:hypothetical protein